MKSPEERMTAMTDNDRLYFKQLLLAQFRELAGRANASGGEDWEYLPDLVDRASFEMNRDLSFHLRDRERQLIRQIGKTIESIEDGTFGVCEECGEEIPIARLRARPVTTFCIECKQKQETAHRLTA